MDTPRAAGHRALHPVIEGEPHLRRALIIPLYVCYAILALAGLAAIGIERQMAKP